MYAKGPVNLSFGIRKSKSPLDTQGRDLPHNKLNYYIELLNTGILYIYDYYKQTIQTFGIHCWL